MRLESTNFGFRLNTKNLMLPDTKKMVGAWFDPEKDLTDYEYLEMKKEVDDDWQENHLEAYVRHAYQLRSLLPSKTELLVDSTEVWPVLKPHLNSSSRQLSRNDDPNVWGDYITLATYSRWLLPDKQSEWRVNPRVEQYLLDEAQKGRRKGNMWEFIIWAEPFLKLYPEKMNKLDLNSAWDGVRDQFEHVRERTRDLDPEKQDSLISAGSAIKLLYPDRYSLLKVTRDEIARVRACLDFYRDEELWNTLSTLAFDTVIMASERAVVTQKGLEIVMPGQREVTPPVQLPNIRRF